MDFNQLAKDIIQEYKKYKVTDSELGEILGVTRQTVTQKIANNSLTTEDLTRLSAKIVTYFGGGDALFNFVERYTDKIRSK